MNRRHLRLAHGDRPGLVHRQCRGPPRRLDIGAALDEHPGPSRGREGRDDGDRRRDDQSAGAGNDQKDQSIVEPVVPGAAEQEWRQHRDGDRQSHHDGRVDTRELGHPLFDRRAAGMGIAHHANDFRKHRVRRGLRRPHRQCALAVDRAGIDLVAGFHGH